MNKKIVFTKKELDKGIIVYRPNFPELDYLLDLVKKSMSENTLLLNAIDKNSFPNPFDFGWHKTSSEYNIDKNDIPLINLKYLEKMGFEKEKEVQVLRKIFDIYNAIFSDYLNEIKDNKFLLPYVTTYDINDKSWIVGGLSLLKHNAVNKFLDKYKIITSHESLLIEDLDSLSLSWHFDKGREDIGEGIHHSVTGNFYLNDDYEGGRILFLYGQDQDSLYETDKIKCISYQPKAGDIILYPAQWPFGHSVSFTYNKDRFFFSTLLTWNYDGSMGDKLNYYNFTNSHLQKITLKNKTKINNINGRDLVF